METEKIRLSDGREYPCFQTMGALAMYARLSGKDLGGQMNMSDMATWLYSLASESSRAMGIEFPFDSVESFACLVGIDEFTAWSNRTTGEAAKKKVGPKK